ncbi:Sapep family Mn(2+)-dependent dipeptidase [Clostridium sardiniense]
MKEDEKLDMKNVDKDSLEIAFYEKVLEYRSELLFSIRRLVQINSVEGKKSLNAPFGENPKRALEEALRISRKLGFRTKNIGNAIGYAEYGEGEEYIAIIGHVDVVPAGKGWTYPPFDLSVKDGKIFGRGVLDNKGPIMAALYGMKIIKDLNLKISRKIRVIFGTNEETGFKDIPYYLNEEKPPIMGFTPDCKYPAVYGERGILDVTIWSNPIKDCIIKSIKGNFRNNMVPDFAEIEIFRRESLDGENINWQTEVAEKISVKGSQAPGNAPEAGENAITTLCKTLHGIGNSSFTGELKEFIEFVYKNFHENYSLEKSGIECKDDISGSLVVNPYKLSISGDRIGLSVVFRYPITYTHKNMISIIESIINEGYKITENRRMDSVCFDKDHELLKKLQESYETVTGFDGTPVTTTGGTYAKVFPNIVAFGPSFPGQKGIGHNKDEYMYIRDLLLNTEIFTNAIYNLAK